jgi:hypothetical protein
MKTVACDTDKEGGGRGMPRGSIQYIWAPDGHLVLRDRYDSTSAAPGGIGYAGSFLNERLYAMQDAAGNVTSLADYQGNVLERHGYTPEGKEFFSAADNHLPEKFNFRYGWHSARRDLGGLWNVGGVEYDYLTGAPLKEDPGAYERDRHAYGEWAAGHSEVSLNGVAWSAVGWVQTGLTVAVGVGLSVIAPPFGAVLLGAGLGYLAAQGVDGYESGGMGGAVANVTGWSSAVEGWTGRDYFTGEDLGLDDLGRSQLLSAAAVQLVGTAYGGYRAMTSTLGRAALYDVINAINPINYHRGSVASGGLSLGAYVGPESRTLGVLSKVGSNIINFRRFAAKVGESGLHKRVAEIPDEILLSRPGPTSDPGADVVSFNRRTGQVTLWDDKYIGKLNARYATQPQSNTFANSSLRASAARRAIGIVRASNLSATDQVRALKSLQSQTFQTRTAAWGPGARSSRLE